MPGSNEDPKADRHSLLEGWQISLILNRCNVSVGKFKRDSGLATHNVAKILGGQFDNPRDIPISIDAVLRAYLDIEDARTTTERLFPQDLIDSMFPTRPDL